MERRAVQSRSLCSKFRSGYATSGKFSRALQSLYGAARLENRAGTPTRNRCLGLNNSDHSRATPSPKGVIMNCVHKMATAIAAATFVLSCAFAANKIGREVAVPVHLQDGDEFQMTPSQLASFGKTLFTAMWTSQEGAGRPITKGTGNPLSDPTSPLVFPHNFNRISGPDTNSCSGCHNKPDIGGGGDIVGNVFVLGQRF